MDFSTGSTTITEIASTTFSMLDPVISMIPMIIGIAIAFLVISTFYMIVKRSFKKALK